MKEVIEDFMSDTWTIPVALNIEMPAHLNGPLAISLQ